MALFYIAYDLDKPGQDYQNLWDELDSLGAKRVQDSVWALRSDTSAKELRDVLKKHIDSDDRLLVVQSGDWASRNLMHDPNKL